MPSPRYGVPSNDSSVRSPTRTSSDVRSPTRTSTWADTEGNVTVTGGAGAGRTSVTINKPAAASEMPFFLAVLAVRNAPKAPWIPRQGAFFLCALLI